MYCTVVLRTVVPRGRPGVRIVGLGLGQVYRGQKRQFHTGFMRLERVGVACTVEIFLKVAYCTNARADTLKHTP